MANEEPDIFNTQLNVYSNSNNPRGYQTDLLIPDKNFNQISRTLARSNQPNYLGNQTYTAVVVEALPKNSPPIGGTSWSHVLTSVGDVNTDNITQVRAVVSDGPDLCIPMVTDLSKQALGQSGEQQKRLLLTTPFVLNGPLSAPLSPGSIIEVSYNNSEFTEGTIRSVIKAAPIIEAKSQSAKDAFNSTDNVSSLSDTGTQSGDSTNTSNLSTISGKCGGIGQYAQADCKTAKLTATGQSVTLHPDFWSQIDQLVTQIMNETGYKIKIGGSARSTDQQVSLRKSRCPEWSLLLSDMSEQEIMSLSWSKMNSKIKTKNGKGCSDSTPVAAAYGSSASNHLKGLAVDLTMDVKSCPASNSSQSGWQNCRNTSKVFNYMNKYASSYGIKNYNVEPWHWSWNGG